MLIVDGGMSEFSVGSFGTLQVRIAKKFGQNVSVTVLFRSIYFCAAAGAAMTRFVNR